jgi:beta-xylosidase
VNRFGLQVFRASSQRGPWSHNRIEQGLHDLSVLFDDDGKIYAVYGARTIRIVELNQDLTALVPGTDDSFPATTWQQAGEQEDICPFFASQESGPKVHLGGTCRSQKVTF